MGGGGYVRTGTSGAEDLDGGHTGPRDTAAPTDLVLAGPQPGVLQDVEPPFLPPTAGRISVDLSRGQTWRRESVSLRSRDAGPAPPQPRGGYQARGGSSPSRCSSCSGPHRSASRGRADAGCARRTGARYSCGSARWPHGRSPRRGCGGGRAAGGQLSARAGAGRPSTLLLVARSHWSAKGRPARSTFTSSLHPPLRTRGRGRVLPGRQLPGT